MTKHKHSWRGLFSRPRTILIAAAVLTVAYYAAILIALFRIGDTW